MSPPSLASLARRWLVAAVAAAGDGQNILPMSKVVSRLLKRVSSNFAFLAY
jgi:hypothetical protein